MVVGLVVGLLQAITQVQEQTVSFVPKLRGHGAGAEPDAALARSARWSSTRTSLIANIPNTL